MSPFFAPWAGAELFARLSAIDREARRENYYDADAGWDAGWDVAALQSDLATKLKSALSQLV